MNQILGALYKILIIIKYFISIIFILVSLWSFYCDLQNWIKNAIKADRLLAKSNKPIDPRPHWKKTVAILIKSA